MDYIFTDSARINTDILPAGGEIDIDIGKDDDLQVTVPLKLFESESMLQGGFIYSPGTELGGHLNEFESDTSESKIEFTGKTFRGMLKERFTEPAAGEDYLVVTGELNRVIASICGSSFYGGLFRVSDADTEVSVTSFKVGRYYSYLDAISQILESVGYRINLEVVEYEESDLVNFYVEISARPVMDYSDEIEHSQDGLVHFKIKKKETMPYNYMLCLGKGNLASRIVIRLKIADDGKSTSIVSSIPDTATTRVYIYEDTNAETATALKEGADNKLEELRTTDSQKITLADNMQVWMGDVVGGRDYVTGLYITQPITRIIYKHTEKGESFSYTIGDE